MKQLFSILFLCAITGAACSTNPLPTDPAAYVLTYDRASHDEEVDHLFVEFPYTAPQTEDYDDIEGMIDLWSEPIDDSSTAFDTSCEILSEELARCTINFPKASLPKCEPYSIVIKAEQRIARTGEDGITTEDVQSISTPSLDVSTASPVEGETLTCLNPDIGDDRDSDGIPDTEDQCPDTAETLILSTLTAANGVADGCPTTAEDTAERQVVDPNQSTPQPVLNTSAGGCSLTRNNQPIGLWPLLFVLSLVVFRRRFV